MATIAETENQKAEETNQTKIAEQNKPVTSAPSVASEVDHSAPLAGFLSITEPTAEQREQLKAVWAYAEASTEDKSVPSLLYAIQKIENRLSSPRLGETRLDKVYRYVKLQKQVDIATKMRDSMMRAVTL